MLKKTQDVARTKDGIGEKETSHFFFLYELQSGLATKPFSSVVCYFKGDRDQILCSASTALLYKGSSAPARKAAWKCNGS